MVVNDALWRTISCDLFLTRRAISCDLFVTRRTISCDLFVTRVYRLSSFCPCRTWKKWELRLSDWYVSPLSACESVHVFFVYQSCYIISCQRRTPQHIAHLRRQCYKSKCVIFSHERDLKVLKCYNFPWFQRRLYCCPATSFANCVMTLFLLKVNSQTFLSVPITQKMHRFWVVTHLVQMSYIYFGEKRLPLYCDQ